MAERMRQQEQNDHPQIEHDTVGDGAKVAKLNIPA